MATILWVGTKFFGPALAEFGHDVHFVSAAPRQCYGWDELRSASGVAKPDVLVVSDQSTPPFVLGMESFPCLTALYCIDSHIHSWQPLYAQGFDFCLVSLKDDLPLFRGKRLSERQLLWSPAFYLYTLAEHETASLPDKQWDMLFVGTIDPLVNIARHHFMQELSQQFPTLRCLTGNFTKFFPQAKLILNHSIAGDLNFRVFEALGCGACLLTPRIANGQDEFFTEAEDLFLYDQRDVSGLAALARDLLQKPEDCARVAANGLSKIKKHHLSRHRAAAFSERLDEIFADGVAVGLIRERLATVGQIREKYLRLIYLLHAESIEAKELKSAYLAAGRGAFQG